MKHRLPFAILFLLTALLQAQVLDRSWRTIINNKDQAWFTTAEAKKIAENVLLYQRDIGGWPKNTAMHLPITEADKSQLLSEKSNGQGATTDNGATIQEMLFLSKIYDKVPDERYRASFLKGLDYLLEAQYDNGGWPQFYPLRKGYYSHITYNDDSMINIMKLLLELKNKTGYYAIAPSEEQLKTVELALEKGIDCILKTQLKQNGLLTAWCAQYDEKTLKPAKARAYELVSLSGKESAQIVLFLMSLQNPSEEIINSVQSAVTWFENVKISGFRIARKFNDKGKTIDKKVVADATAPALWARFMEIDDNTPFFSDRDGIKKASLAEIGEERRNGYAWYTDEPLSVLQRYDRWKQLYSSRSTSPAVNKLHQDDYYITVAQDGTGDYKSIQEAINNSKSFPYERVTIFVKNGLYKEKVKIHEWNPNLALIGESRDSTIISYDDYFDKIGKGRNSTFYTYTLLVEATNVLIKNVTIENASGDIGQAVALSVVSDEVAVVNCNLLGHQDTLYASGKGKQYYKDCYIEGTTDFIFGSATAFFDNCDIHSKKNSYITAASTPEISEFGYVFKDCRLSADQGVTQVYLGRPWRLYAKTVFINCKMEEHILPIGWHNWSKPEAEKTTFYAEYKNYGPGFQPEKRIGWSRQLTAQEAKTYRLKTILGKYKSATKKEWYEAF